MDQLEVACSIATVPVLIWASLFVTIFALNSFPCYAFNVSSFVYFDSVDPIDSTVSHRIRWLVS